MKFKGFCLIFYPIIVIYSIISAYAFASDKTILEFQFPIIAACIIAIYFAQALYETIRKKNGKIIILPSIMLVATVVLISLFGILETKLLGTIISALLIPVIAYELIILIVDFKNNKYKEIEPVIEEEKEITEE